MASLVCRKCGAEERNTRMECLPCKRVRRAAEYARKVGRTPEPVVVVKPCERGELWRFDECDEERDPLTKRKMMAVLWNDYIQSCYFSGPLEPPTLDALHVEEMCAIETEEYRAASDAEFAARRQAARHGYK